MYKRSSRMTAAVVILVGMMILGGILFLAHLQMSSMPQFFNTNKKGAAKKYYSQVMERDMIDDYPKNPDDLMDFYCTTLYLLYGDMLTETEPLQAVLEQQRYLYSEEILRGTSLEEQYENVVLSLKELADSQVYIRRIEKSTPIYAQTDSRRCVVRLVQYNQNLETVYWNFHLYRFQDGKWKIISREVTDHNYNPLEDSA